MFNEKIKMESSPLSEEPENINSEEKKQNKSESEKSKVGKKSFKFFDNKKLKKMGTSPAQRILNRPPSPDKEEKELENNEFWTEDYIIEKVEDVLGSFEKKKTSQEKEISKDDIDKSLEKVVRENDHSYTFQVRDWLKKAPEENMEYIEDKLSELIKQNEDLNLSTLVLLSETNQERGAPSKEKSFLISEELIKSIECNVFPSKELMDQIALVNRLNTETSNALMHKILDFFQIYLSDLQNDHENSLQEERHHFYVFLHHKFLIPESEMSQNYLVKKHFEDLVEALNLAQANKEGALHGVAGGNGDEMIYTFSHIDESYKYRQALGINESYPAASPVLPIAPEYVGMYKKGKLDKVFSVEDVDFDKEFKERENKYIEQNNSEYNYIYDEINDPIELPGQNIHPSNKLQKLRDIWDFNDQLERDNENFYFDLSRVDAEELHPVVYADLMTRNQRYIHDLGETENKKESLPQEEFLELLSPQKEISEDQLIAYQNLTKLHMRKKIEDEFGFDVSELDFWSQRNFLEFLNTRDVDNVNELKNFVKEYGVNGLKTFLSLELGEVSGEEILNIGKNLEDEPEAAQRLFSKFAEITDSAEESVEEVVKMYNEIFFNKKIDRNKAINAILKKAFSLLEKAAAELENCPEEQKEKLINSLIVDLKREEKIQHSAIVSLKDLMVEFNKKYLSLEISYSGFVNTVKEYLPEQGEKLANDIRNIQKMNKNGEIDKDTRKEMIGKLKKQAKDKLLQGVKYDSSLLRKKLKWLVDRTKFEGEPYDIVVKYDGKEEADKFKKYIEEQDQEIYGKYIDIFKELNSFQQNIEEKFDQFVYGQESASLPENFDQEIVQGIENYQSELPDSDKKPYLPVGISSLLPKEGEVHAKPIDAFAYMLWLQNQGKEADFMVVDTIQESNYQSLYGLDQEEARKKAKVNGQRDEQWYRSIKENFGLDNIDFADYSGLEQSEEFREAKKIIDDLDKGENRSEIISGALDNMVEKSVKGKASQEEIENLKEYGKKEIAFIMARKDLKISHEKEYRYDIMARVISVYKELKDRLEELKDSRHAYLEERGVPKKKIGKILKELESDKSLTELSLYLSYYEDYPRTYHLAADIFGNEERARNLKNQKDKSSKDKSRELKIKATNLRGQMTSLASQYEAEEEKVKPINKNIDNLGLLKRGTEAKHIINKWRGFGESIKKEDWFRNLNLPEFYYPKQITGMSFEMQDEKNPGYTSFREFYSTYKGESEEELPIEANQVIASTSPLAASKLLVLDEKKQREYYEKVLKPLLVNYYVATSKDKEEASRRFEQEGAQNKTISEIIHFIQNSIVKPVKKDLESNNQ
ncbi:MAG: hypothetical protein R6V40_02175 [Candidatus Moraniibacteriota bacterium]